MASCSSSCALSFSTDVTDGFVTVPNPSTPETAIATAHVPVIVDGCRRFTGGSGTSGQSRFAHGFSGAGFFSGLGGDDPPSPRNIGPGPCSPVASTRKNTSPNPSDSICPRPAAANENAARPSPCDWNSPPPVGENVNDARPSPCDSNSASQNRGFHKRGSLPCWQPSYSDAGSSP